MRQQDQLRADRLNTEPLIFRGCSYSELSLLLLLCTLLWLPLGFVIGGMVGKVTMGLGFATLGTLGTVVLLATLLQQLKRGRPQGYYAQRVAVFLHDTGLRPTSLIRRSGYWDVGRTDRSQRL